ncbi:MAG: phosphatidylserine decarboxylase [Thermodesulfobacteriota bacterium]
MGLATHQYLERHTGKVCTERLFGDRLVRLLYSEVRENAPFLFRAVTSARGSRLLSLLNFETLLGARLRNPRDLIRSWGVDLSECLEDIDELDTPQKLFTRRIRYEQCRPMPADPRAVVSPADSRLLLGSFNHESLLFIKNKFFDFTELIGGGKTRWLRAFAQGPYALFRLTPEKYHYLHAPVTGRVVDIYEINGQYHSCNPTAALSPVQPFSKNKRVVTVVDTDVPGGSRAGLVAMAEVVALMVGEIEQCYSSAGYEDPQPVLPGLLVQKGQPKSVFKPGSSTVVLLFQPGRVTFDQDLVDNQRHSRAASRFSLGLGRPLVETELKVREQIGWANPQV